ncbi:MAG: GerMN domain-containing protein [Deltaproteobacteria bacterium]|nr:GerMN domain-containing protein [Deltaproteobacteria bacterium]
MRKGLIIFGVILAFVAAGMAGIGVYRSWKHDRSGIAVSQRPGKAAEGEAKVIDLYFSDADDRRLAIEPREIGGRSIEEKVRQAMEALIAGPQKKNLSPTIPKGTKIRGIYYKEATAFVDFTSAISNNHPGGSWTELLTIYSIVNTITENFPEVKKVQILIEGREPETLAGHVDISRPLPGRVQLLAGEW